ncbi:MAG: TetR/AcrR family transcriptional regulator [Planctomycetota bacterium]|jgi:AcrR family transcriptional regulator
MASGTRKPTEVRKREIADAALRVIGEQGAGALTAARIAEEVGVTSGALFRHFGSLAEVLDSAVERAVESVGATFPEADLPPVERLRRLVSARARLMAGNPGLAWLLLSDQVYLTVSPHSVARLRDLVGRSKSFLTAAIREGVANGSLRADIPPQHLLLLLTGTVHSIASIARATGVHRAESAPNPDRVLDSLFTLITPVDYPRAP